MSGFRLAETIAGLRDDRHFRASEIAVLTCIPLERWRYWAQRNLRAEILRLLRLDSDFLRNCDQSSGRDWDTWWRKNIAPASAAVVNLRDQAGVLALRNVTFNKFRRMASDDNISLVFLLAHHPRCRDGVEFGDGVFRWCDIQQALDPSLTIVLIVCESGEWQAEMLKQADKNTPVGGGSYRFPVLEAVQFTSFWIAELVQGEGILRSREKAIVKFFER